MTQGTRATVWAVGAALTVSMAASGCTLGKRGEEVDRFREAIPEADAVTLPGPESNAEASSSSSSANPGQRAQTTNDGGATTSWAKYYGVTRELRDGVRNVTGAVLGAVWIIVHTEPSSVGHDEAIWGPWTDSLEPASWRFRIREVAEREYDYYLEGRPKSATDDAEFRPVLSGKGWGKLHPKHGDGFFEIDLDVARELDPFKHQNDSGTVKITHDLPPTITSNLFALPKLVSAEVRPTTSSAWYSISSQANENRTGTLEFSALADVDDSAATALEDVLINSRWRADGAGRSDITLAGGDVPELLGTISAVECWSSDFARVYYLDSVEYEAAFGDAAACAYGEP